MHDMNISQVQIKRELTQTNHSKVYLGRLRQGEDEKEAVIKRVKPNKKELFRREIYSLKQNMHPNIVSILGYDASKTEIYLEFIDGITLSKHLEFSGKISIAEAVNILFSVSEGLKYIHSASNNKPAFAHYDISDNNIILKRKELKILDFGFAYPLGNVPSEYSEIEVGQPEWMSPEKLDCKPDLGAKSDIFAFGILAYKTVSGMLPFSSCYGCVRTQIRTYDPPKPDSQNLKLDNLIMECISKNPNDRPDISEINAYLKTFVQDF